LIENFHGARREIMCEAHAYMLRDTNEEKILESVDLMELDGDDIHLVNIFGEQKTIKGKLTRYNNREGKIIIEPI
jgi:predicted RNA-binding protein